MWSKKTRQKYLVSLFFLMIFLSLVISVVSGHYFFISLLLLFGAPLCVLFCEPRNEWSRTHIGEVILVSAGFAIPVFFAINFRHEEISSFEKFKNYLLEHDCSYSGDGYAYSPAADDEIVTEEEFFCRSTGRKITFSDFKNSDYGR